MTEQKDRILQTCLRHFLRHGIRKMTNEKLVALLGISTKTLYKHFGDKEGLLEEVLHLYHDERYIALLQKPSDHGKAGLLLNIWISAVESEPKVSRLFYKDLNHYYPELAARVESSISKKFSDRFLQIIELGVNEGSFRKDINPKVVLEAIYALYVSLVRNRRYEGTGATSIDMILDTIGIYIRGFCTPKGMKELDVHIARNRGSAGRAGIIKGKYL